MTYQQPIAVAETTTVPGSSFSSFSSTAVATTMAVVTASSEETMDGAVETTAHASSLFYFFSAAVEMATTITTAVVVAADSNSYADGEPFRFPFFYSRTMSLTLYRHIPMLFLYLYLDWSPRKPYQIFIEYLSCVLWPDFLIDKMPV